MNYMDNLVFIGIREGVTFYYFGNGCIADYYGESIAYLDNTDIFLISVCDGSRTLSKCIEQIKRVIDETATYERIDRMRRKGVLVIKEHPSSNNAFFMVKKDYFILNSLQSSSRHVVITIVLFVIKTQKLWENIFLMILLII